MTEKSKFMLRAIELSIQSAKTKGGPFGSVIVKDNKIIAEGFNQVTANNDPTAHAEIVAIRKACENQNNFFAEIAYDNSVGQIVLSGLIEDLEKLIKVLKTNNIKNISAELSVKSAKVYIQNELDSKIQKALYSDSKLKLKEKL